MYCPPDTLTCPYCMNSHFHMCSHLRHQWLQLLHLFRDIPRIPTLVHTCVTSGSNSSTTGVAFTRFASSTAMLPQRFFRSTLAPALISSFTCDAAGVGRRALGVYCSTKFIQESIEIGRQQSD